MRVRLYVAEKTIHFNPDVIVNVEVLAGSCLHVHPIEIHHGSLNALPGLGGRILQGASLVLLNQRVGPAVCLLAANAAGEYILEYASDKTEGQFPLARLRMGSSSVLLKTSLDSDHRFAAPFVPTRSIQVGQSESVVIHSSASPLPAGCQNVSPKELPWIRGMTSPRSK